MPQVWCRLHCGQAITRLCGSPKTRTAEYKPVFVSSGWGWSKPPGYTDSGAEIGTIFGMSYGGPDWSTLTADGGFDLDPSFGLISDPFQIVAEHVLRRWVIEPGELDIATIGAGLNSWLNGNLDQADYDELTAKLRSSALDVDGLADIALTPSLDAEGNLTITASISLESGENFPTIFSLSADGAIQLIVDGGNQ